jgi:hypothetical protein
VFSKEGNKLRIPPSIYKNLRGFNFEGPQVVFSGSGISFRENRLKIPRSIYKNYVSLIFKEFKECSVVLVSVLGEIC